MEVEEEFDPYKVLEISPGVSKEDVKKAYRKLCTLYHPDKVATLGEDLKKVANKKMQDMNKAYEMLMRNYEQGDSGASKQKQKGPKK
ncbi:DnaJ domain-containing protein [candidate division NPL-UPA2 bacterium]|nr:DnaJ domain-containing protein [candidate division NPL-UPA2 bacterium]